MSRAGLVVVLMLVAMPAARAHPLAPALLALREMGDGRAQVTWKTPLLRPRGTAPGPVLPAGCRPLTSPVVSQDAISVRTEWTVACGPGGLAGARVGVDGLVSAAPAALVRVQLADGQLVEDIVSAERPFLTVPGRSRGRDLMADYVRRGIARILGVPEGFLFVLGLVLLGGTGIRLVSTLVAFSVGHSITLALATLGGVDLPLAPIAAAVAASVFLLAVELARTPGAPTLLGRHPWVTALAFGVLHGLAFAGALRDDTGSATAPLALLSFNVGIEVGQAVTVAVVLVLRRALARVPGGVRRVPVYAMGSLAACWWLERTAALFR